MLLQVVLFLVGLTLLYFGAEWLVKGASAIALHFGIRPIVVGLTVVALGTSMPEFVVNLAAAVGGGDAGGDLALGNIVGSNIANIGLILGLSAIVAPLLVPSTTLKREYPFFVGVMALFFGLSLDGDLGALDGVILLLVLVGFLTYLIMDTRARSRDSKAQDAVDAALADVGLSDAALSEVGLESAPASTSASMGRRVVLLAVGTVLLAVGAKMMVDAAVFFAERLDIAPEIIGLTVVAIGTSLPELAASVMGAAHGEEEMSLGNVLGSNILNVLFVIGTVALITPINVIADQLSIHMPIMLVFSLVLLPMAWLGRRISRLEGFLLLVGFICYIGYAIWPYVT